ncbi:DUF1365 family protein [Sinorhizobium sp. GL28]|uniref:DUF1365 family protein n=1 Tax=Sinorhizobium sp. GL28 TaxID=1358418 RepID=UPI00071C6B57|nr:DUF1365 family protein [Sinorhizobium sp. GL28]KSV95147.1 hypothetical protein N184_35480 [Sinorhizobium sp. GL28]
MARVKLLVDIDRLDELDRMSRLLSVDRPGILSFHTRDHVEHENETVREFVDRLLAQAGIASGGRWAKLGKRATPAARSGE